MSISSLKSKSAKSDRGSPPPTPAPEIPSASQIRVEAKDSTVCPFSGMTGDQKRCLVDSWSRMQDGTHTGLEAIGRRMVVWMFENIDDMFKLFFKMEKRKSSHIQQWFDGRTNLGEHNLRFAQSMSRLISNINDKKEFNRCLADIILVHLSLEEPIGYKYFKQYEERVSEFIMQELNVSRDADEVTVWTILAQQLAKKCLELGSSDEEFVRKKSIKNKKCCKIM